MNSLVTFNPVGWKSTQLVDKDTTASNRSGDKDHDAGRSHDSISVEEALADTTSLLNIQHMLSLLELRLDPFKMTPDDRLVKKAGSIDVTTDIGKYRNLNPVRTKSSPLVEIEISATDGWDSGLMQTTFD